jgi:hypothetical protein
MGTGKGAGGAERAYRNPTAQQLAAPRQELTDALSEVLVDFVRESLSKTTDRNKMRRLLRWRAPLTDLSPVGKMRDVCPLVIMRIEHMITLLQNDATAKAIAWLSLSLCFNAVRLETITRETRLFMLHVSFFMVKNLYHAKKSGQNPNPETSKRKKTTIFTSEWSIRFLNTVPLLIFSIENYESLALNRESTHPLENFFGYVKIDAPDINTPDEMTRTIPHIDIVKEVYRLFELEEVVPGQANLTGLRLEAEPTNEIMSDIVMANLVAPEIIAAICLKATHAEVSVLTEEEKIAFLQFREYLGLLKPAVDASRTRNEINSHSKLGSGSRIIRLLTLHGKSQAGELHDVVNKQQDIEDNAFPISRHVGCRK